MSAIVFMALSLMPIPFRINAGEGRLIIDGNFRVVCRGPKEPLLDRAVQRFVERLARRTGLHLAAAAADIPTQATLEIRCNAAAEPVQSIRTDESYTLSVTQQRALLSAASPVGVIRGLETFLHSIEADQESFLAPAIEIEDQPRFPWRGLLIDVCRHWQPPEVIKRNLDAMAAVKLNVFHWHLSEDQGFRVESKRFPRLHQLGSDGKYYTQEEVREIVAYARDRGIRVVPEFDMPGHTTAWFAGYPELAAAPGPYRIARDWGGHEPCMDPSRESVWAFIDSFLEEMAALFPDEFLHIGGDEVNGKQWNANPAIRRFKRDHGMKDNHDLQAYFTRRIAGIAKRHGKRIVGWDEILHPGMTEEALVQSWRSQDSLAAAARKGYKGILSFGYYLDLVLPASSHYSVDPLGKEAASLTAREQSRILGGEACMWGEYVTAENIDSRIWPRAAAVAERLWSPAGVTDVSDMYRRLEIVDRDLDILGLNHRNKGMLERLAGEHAVGPLETLAGIVEPIKNHSRGRTRHYTALTPLNRLVDAALPESDKARHFAQDVDQSDFRALRRRLQQWRDNDAEIQPMLAGSFLLGELAPLSRKVRDVAQIGLEAIDYLESGRRPPDTWRGEKSALLELAQRPEAELQIAIISSVRKLVDSAAGF